MYQGHLIFALSVSSSKVLPLFHAYCNLTFWSIFIYLSTFPFLPYFCYNFCTFPPIFHHNMDISSSFYHIPCNLFYWNICVCLSNTDSVTRFLGLCLFLKIANPSFQFHHAFHFSLTMSVIASHGFLVSFCCSIYVLSLSLFCHTSFLFYNILPYFIPLS